MHMFLKYCAKSLLNLVFLLSIAPHRCLLVLEFFSFLVWLLLSLLCPYLSARSLFKLLFVSLPFRIPFYSLSVILIARCPFIGRYCYIVLILFSSFHISFLIHFYDLVHFFPSMYMTISVNFLYQLPCFIPKLFCEFQFFAVS